MTALMYNTGVNHIKSRGMLKHRHGPFSTYVRGVDTMSDHTRVPYFPENLQDYAPWVAKHGLTAPYGECQCGCGGAVRIAPCDKLARDQARGHPVRFIMGHANRKYPLAEHPNPSGLCLCGCGQPTPISKVTRNKAGYVKGLPIRYVPGHGMARRYVMQEPNPSGLCMCGCGQPAPIALYTRVADGVIEGKPLRFIHNHHLNVGPSLEERFWEKVDKRGPDECWSWTGSRNGAGYGKLGGEEGSQYAHRVSYELANGVVPDGLYVCHHCDNPPCVNPDHLFLGTSQDNADDMVSKGRGARGERSRNAKLTSIQVIEMRELYATGTITKTDLARKYNVTRSAIRRIVNGEGWAHLPLPQHGFNVPLGRRTTQP